MQDDHSALIIQLHQILSQRLDIEDLRTLSFYMGVEYDDLRGEGRVSKTRELIKYLDNRRQLSKLVAAGEQLRPDIDWPVAPKAVEQIAAVPVTTRQPFEPEMILIPAGDFRMGSDPTKDKDAQDCERPQHTLYLPDYYLAKTPVTNAQYEAFVEATYHRQPDHWEGRKPPSGKEDHPVVYVSWRDAVAYCLWLAEVTGQSYRLPSEAEWEKGARGTDGRIYPWGDRWDETRCNSGEDGRRDTTPVGAYPHGASPYGLLDMAGNVWEWTSSLWGEVWETPEFKYPYDPTDGRENLDARNNVHRVLRGGSFGSSEGGARCAFRFRNFPYLDFGYYGFRVAAAPFSPDAAI